MKRIIEFSCAVIIALIPSIVLYWIFKDLNIAAFKESGLELGGPAALFFVVLYTALRYFQKKYEDPLAELKRELKGMWLISSESAKRHTATSTCDIEYKEGNLNMSGGQFTSGDKVIGPWHADAIFLKNDQFLYIYELTEAGGTGATWKGLVTLNILKKDDKLSLQGCWETIGSEYKHGTIVYERQ